MPSLYLQGADLATYGQAAATQQQVAAASAMVDAYLFRPSGLVYVPDATGQPCYMAALSPEVAVKSTSAFGPGNGLVVPVAGPVAGLQVGDCVVLDRTTNAAAMEAAQITAVDTTSSLLTIGNTAVGSLGALQFSHGVGCSIETGLMITEKRYLPKARSEVNLGQTPVARVVGGTGRYAYGRRGDAANYDMDNFNLLASLNRFGGPPAWEIWPANTAAGINAETGQLWVPAGIMLAYYSEVKVRYVAGYTLANLPAQIKWACSQVITALANNPVLGNVQSFKAGDTAVTQFSASVISDDMKALIAPWRAKLFA